MNERLNNLNLENMTKIEALQKTIFNLENDVYEYRWGGGDNMCNAGILCKTLLNGKNPTECGLNQSPLKCTNTRFYSGAFCLTANLPMPEMYQQLKMSGFSWEDIRDLVYLSNTKITSRLNWKVSEFEGKMIAHNHTKKESLITYLKEWVKMLQTPTVTLTAYQPEIKEPASKFVTYSKIIENIPVNAN